jgi:hypothetical protein
VNVKRDAFAREDVILTKLTASQNLYALKAALSTEAFYNEQMGAINRAIPVPSTPPEGGGDKANEPPVRTRRMIHLNTHTTHPMHTEADVDRYLQSLKEQIMRHLGDDHDIIVS